MSGELSSGERLARLRLARADNVGPVAFRHLLERYRTAARAIEALPGLAARGGSARAPRIPSEADALAELEAGQALGARLICAGEPGLPERLAALDPPPPLIWTLGLAGLLEQPCIAIVGARIASAAGQRFARALAQDLGGAGYVVVSGMARGVDGAAHEGSLKTGSVAVLAGGIDDVYPPEHLGLYQRLTEEGCVVSESPVGRRAQAKDFPRRNRLISGLSLGVVVVEDILRELRAPLPARRPAAPRPEPAELPDEEIDALREKIAGLLSPAAVSRDELVRITGAPAAAVYGALVELSIAGRAELRPGNMVLGA